MIERLETNGRGLLIFVTGGKERGHTPCHRVTSHDCFSTHRIRTGFVDRIEEAKLITIIPGDFTTDLIHSDPVLVEWTFGCVRGQGAVHQSPRSTNPLRTSGYEIRVARKGERRGSRPAHFYATG